MAIQPVIAYYDQGEDATVRGLFVDKTSGQPVDPSSVIVVVQKPDGTTLRAVYSGGSDPSGVITRNGTGDYTATIDLDQGGFWITGRMYAPPGTGKSSAPFEFVVRAEPLS